MGELILKTKKRTYIRGTFIIDKGYPQGRGKTKLKFPI